MNPSLLVQVLYAVTGIAWRVAGTALLKEGRAASLVFVTLGLASVFV